MSRHSDSNEYQGQLRAFEPIVEESFVVSNLIQKITWQEKYISFNKVQVHWLQNKLTINTGIIYKTAPL